jgi:hypothetical protein
MPDRGSGEPRYDDGVFVNCPFDHEYQPLFHAVVFAVYDCGLVPRCSLEMSNAGVVRIHKIIALIKACRWGIHDISRTEANPNGLPRFNMPLELGIFLGAQHLGAGTQQQKSCLVLDSERYRYQEFISDIAGQDVESHSGDPAKAITAVRNWLATSIRNKSFPGGDDIATRFGQFQQDLPGICTSLRIDPGKLIFADYTRITYSWQVEKLMQ